MSNKTLTLRIAGDPSDALAALKTMERKLASMERAATTSGVKVKTSSAALGSFLGNMGANVVSSLGSMFGTFMSGTIDGARESAKVGRLTEAVIKSTGGAAKVTAEQVGELATAISNKTGMDDEAIQSASNMLLTFTNVRNEVGEGKNVFDRATQTVADMSAAMGTDMKGSSVMLGKALNDPIKGISALSRVGVTFTDQQKEQIKQMMKAGDVAGAQGVILDELGKEFGGAAEAASDPMQKLTTVLGNVQETIGAALLPVIEKASTWLVDNLPGAVATAQAKFEEFRPTLEKVGETIGTIFTWVMQNKDTLLPLAAGVAAFVAAWKAFSVVSALINGFRAALAGATIAQYAINLAMSLNPIGLIIAAFAALAAGIYLLWNNNEGFRNWVIGLWEGIKTAFGAAKDWLVGAWNTIVGAFNNAKTWLGRAMESIKGFISRAWGVIKTVLSWSPLGLIITNWGAITGKVREIFNKVKSTITGVIDKVKTGWSNLWNGFKGVVSSAMSGLGNILKRVLNGPIDLINSFIGKVNGLKNGIPFVGGSIPNIPSIPRLAKGGIVQARPGGIPAIIGEGRYDEAVIPLKPGMGLGGSPVIVNVNVGGSVMAERDLAKSIATAVRDEIVRNGKRNGSTGL